MGVLLLVRHGQASFGADDYDVLSETGWEQARALGRWLRDHAQRPRYAVRGGMRRHRETWEALADGGGWADLDARVDDDWDEFDHLAVLERHPEQPDGDLDRRAFQRYFEDATARWTTGLHGGYPEPYADFLARARRALDRVARDPAPTLVVTSGGVVAALAALLVAPEAEPSALGPIWTRFNTVVANASVTRVIVGSTGARLLTFNEHPHLPRDLVTYR